MAVLLATALIGRAAAPSLIAVAALLAVAEFGWRLWSRGGHLPATLLLFAPLLLLRFTSVADFEVRLLTFTALAILIPLARHPLPARWRISFLSWRAPARWLLAWLILAAASLVMTSRGVWLSGDEPHYVMLAQSLVEDHDFDVRNNMEGGTYRSFHPVELEFHGSVHDGGFYLFHLPGLSFLLAPFYLLWRLLGLPLAAPLYFRLVAALIGATFALLLFRALRTLLPDTDPSPGWLLFVSTFPLLFHGCHLYPEIPAATLTLGAFLLMAGERRHPLPAGLLLALVPWFHIKYTLGVVVVGLWMAWQALRRRDLRQLAALALVPVCSALLLAFYSHTLYGSYSPDAIFPHGDYWTVPLSLRVQTFLAILLDQRDGLLVYAPLILLLPLTLRSRLPQRGLMAALLFGYLASHAFTTVRGAYSPAGRPVMFAAWALFLLLAAFAGEHRHDGWGRLLRLLGAFGILASGILLCHPLFAYQAVTQATRDGASSLLLFLGSDTIPLPALLPSFLKLPTAPPHPANLVWLGLLGLLVSLYYLRRRPVDRTTSGKTWVTLLLFLAAVGLTCVFPHLHLSRTNRLPAGAYTLFSPSRNVAPLAPQGRFRVRAGDRYDLFLAAAPLAARPAVLRFDPLPPGVRLLSGRRLLLASHGGETLLRLERTGLHEAPGTRPAVVHLTLDLRERPASSFLFFSLEPAP